MSTVKKLIIVDSKRHLDELVVKEAVESPTLQSSKMHPYSGAAQHPIEERLNTGYQRNEPKVLETKVKSEITDDRNQHKTATPNNLEKQETKQTGQSGYGGLYLGLLGALFGGVPGFLLGLLGSYAFSKSTGHE